MNFRKRFKSNWKESKTDAWEWEETSESCTATNNLRPRVLYCRTQCYASPLFSSSFLCFSVSEHGENYKPLFHTSQTKSKLFFLLLPLDIPVERLRYFWPVQMAEIHSAHTNGQDVVTRINGVDMLCPRIIWALAPFWPFLPAELQRGKSRSKNAAAVPCFCLLRVDRMCNTVS